LKIAVRVVEYGRRIYMHLPASCVEKTLLRTIALGLPPSGRRPGRVSREAADAGTSTPNALQREWCETGHPGRRPRARPISPSAMALVTDPG
jgi:hypothetical protein